MSSRRLPIETFDLLGWLDSLGVDYWEEGPNVSAGWIGLQCPWCDDDHNHLGVSLHGKNYSCWRCEAKGSLIALIRELAGLSYGKALDTITDWQGAEYLPPERERLQDDGQDVLPVGCRDLTPAQRQYLERRRYNPDALVQEWGVVGGPLSGPFNHRIIIPLHLRGRTVSYIGADITGTKDDKYKAARVEDSIVPASELVYGYDKVTRGCVVVEGPLDVWRMGPGAVALLGLHADAPHKVQLLADLPGPFTVMLDGETLAIKRAHMLASILRKMGKDVHVYELDEGDPDDLTDEQARELRLELNL